MNTIQAIMQKVIPKVPDETVDIGENDMTKGNFQLEKGNFKKRISKSKIHKNIIYDYISGGTNCHVPAGTFGG
jgi:hypothetical protein